MVLDVKKVVTLPRRQIVCLQLRAAATVHCTSGRVWITSDGVRNDVVLEQGGSYTPRRDERVVVQSLRDAEFFVREERAVRPAKKAGGFLFGWIGMRPVAA